MLVELVLADLPAALLDDRPSGETKNVPGIEKPPTVKSSTSGSRAKHHRRRRPETGSPAQRAWTI